MRIVQRVQSRAVRSGGSRHSLAFTVAACAGRRVDALAGCGCSRRAGIRDNDGARPSGFPPGVGALQPPSCRARARIRRHAACDLAAGAFLLQTGQTEQTVGPGGRVAHRSEKSGCFHTSQSCQNRAAAQTRRYGQPGSRAGRARPCPCQGGSQEGGSQGGNAACRAGTGQRLGFLDHPPQSFSLPGSGRAFAHAANLSVYTANPSARVGRRACGQTGDDHFRAVDPVHVSRARCGRFGSKARFAPCLPGKRAGTSRSVSVRAAVQARALSEK